MAFCLPPEFAGKMKQAISNGQIEPEKLADMTSAERRSYFEKIVGAEDAHPVNALFESKLLLKDYKSGLVTWAKQITGISDPARKDLIARIENLNAVLDPNSEKAFLADLAAQKLGVNVTMDEAKTIAAMSKDLQAQRGKWDATKATADLKADPLNKNAGWASEEARISYGLQVSDMRKYVGDLKNAAAKTTLADVKAHPVLSAKEGLYKALGMTKSLLSSLDNSFFGRQGIRVLYTHPSIWARDFLKSWGDISKTIVGKDAMRLVEADVLSRPNAMNGDYRTMGLDVGISFEEAFPTTLQDNLPGVGRFFRAADTAFSAGAMRMRADLADLLIPKAEEFGLSMKTGADARGVGTLVNSMTGRGRIGGASGKAVNVLFFSAKFLKSNFDTLTGHTLWQGDLSPAAKTFMRREAAMNLVKIAGTTAFILGTTATLNPKATSLDPRSTAFGKIKVGATTVDITGGMASLVTLASRVLPTEHKGKWSFWTVNSKGQYVDLLGGKYGQQTAWDVLLDFMAGKLSPAAGALRDVWKGQNFSGQKPTVLNTTTGLVTPLPIQTYMELESNPKAAPTLLGMIADALGFSTYTPPKKP